MLKNVKNNKILIPTSAFFEDFPSFITKIRITHISDTIFPLKIDGIKNIGDMTNTEVINNRNAVRFDLLEFIA